MMSIHTRLNYAGWGFLALIFCGFLMSVNFSNNLIFAMTFMLCGIALLGWWQTRINLQGLNPGNWRHQPAFAGQPVVYNMRLSNTDHRPKLALTVVADGKPQEGLIALGPASEAGLCIHRQSTKRGELEKAKAYLKGTFPLGIICARSPLPDLPASLVYPKPVGSRPLPETTNDAQAHQRNEAGSFTDMRRYSAGDPVSRIAWRVLARSDEVYVKEFDGAEGQPALWLSWDAVAGLGTEERLSQLCRWVLDAERQGREYGLDIPGVRIPPASGADHEKDCLSALALFGVQR
ncbi:MAG TPA: DUF58 domain-containing protein [Chromatiaceae bacterium]|nr:DUF58 domain-containing protein [Chromatiaceae bacterium]